jgi:branched-chain amino acid transport system permease protein
MYPFKYLTIILIVVSLTGFGNIKSSAWVAVLVGITDTAARFLVPSFGAFVVFFVLIGIMIWRDEMSSPAR